MKKIILLLFIVILISISCASFPAVVPENNSESIIIGLSAYIPGASIIDEVYFIKLNDNDPYLNNNQIIRSNYNEFGRFLLLNAEPGRYIVVAAYDKEEITNSKGEVSSTKHTTYYFPLDFIKITDITVEKGKQYYLGDYVFYYQASLTFASNKADEAQSFYCNRFQPNKLKPSVTTFLIDGLLGALNDEKEFATAINLKESKKTFQSEIAFWEFAIRQLQANFLQKIILKNSVQKYQYKNGEAVSKLKLSVNQEWINIINTKLEELKKQKI